MGPTSKRNHHRKNTKASERNRETQKKLVGAVGIGLKAMLKIRKLLILLNAKNAKNTGFAQPRYTAGTRAMAGFLNLAALAPTRLPGTVGRSSWFALTSRKRTTCAHTSQASEFALPRGEPAPGGPVW